MRIFNISVEKIPKNRKNATRNPQLSLKTKIHHSVHGASQSILTHICCHSERSEESRVRTRGCSRDPSLRSG